MSWAKCATPSAGTSLCIDHFGEGNITADEVIRLGKALEPYDLAWMEDPVCRLGRPGHKQVADALLTPIAAGEDRYLRDGFREAIDKRAVDVIHPDLLTSGGMMETKRISDDAEDEGIPTALHFAGSPIGFMANLHTAAAVSSFVACEHHGLDLPFWEGLVTGLPRLHGRRLRHRARPARPRRRPQPRGIRDNLRTPGTMFLPTDGWNTPKLGFWRPDRRW